MKIKNIGILISALLMAGLCSCGERKANSRLILNEVLMENQTGFQDDYGKHSAWIEVFNKAYSSANLAGCFLRVSSQPGDTVTYPIPKGDVLTQVKPRQHALFWADGQPNRGTFHTNFTLDASKNNWIALYDESGRRQLDQIVVPANTLLPDHSYARVDDASEEWEVKGGSNEKYVTPSTNNKTLDSNAKMEKFQQHDKAGVGMAITAMSVVFTGLVVLYGAFRYIGKTSVKAKKRKIAQIRERVHGADAPAAPAGKVSGEVYAAIAMALHEMQDDAHDVENTVLTIGHIHSTWGSKMNTLREVPHKEVIHH